MESQIVCAMCTVGGIVVAAIFTIWAGSRLLRFGSPGVDRGR